MGTEWKDNISIIIIIIYSVASIHHINNNSHPWCSGITYIEQHTESSFIMPITNTLGLLSTRDNTLVKILTPEFSSARVWFFIHCYQTPTPASSTEKNVGAHKTLKTNTKWIVRTKVLWLLTARKLYIYIYIYKNWCTSTLREICIYHTFLLYFYIMVPYVSINMGGIS